jgi:hypothetical protein
MTDEQELNVAARKLLAKLKDAHVEARGARFTLSRGDEDLLAEFGDELDGTIDWLVSKDLASWYTADGFTITDYGTDVAGDPNLLDRELPTPAMGRDTGGRSHDAMAEVLELNAAGRRLLAYLHGWHVRACGGPFHVGPCRETFDACGFDENQYMSAARWLVSKGLGKWSGLGGVVTITDDGVDVAQDEDLLDRELPLAPRRAPPAEIPRDVADNLKEVRRTALDFVADTELRDILARDIEELEAAIAGGLHKSTALLAGSIVEAMLVDVIDQRRDLAQAYMGKKKFPAEASIDHLVGIGIAEQLIDKLAEAVASSIKDYRDLIHPDRERRSRVRLDGASTGALVALLRLVVRSLHDAHQDGRISAYLNK